MLARQARRGGAEYVNTYAPAVGHDLVAAVLLSVSTAPRRCPHRGRRVRGLRPSQHYSVFFSVPSSSWVVVMLCAKVGPLSSCAACIISGLKAAVASRTRVTW